jgi:hypothetical protein
MENEKIVGYIGDTPIYFDNVVYYQRVSGNPVVIDETKIKLSKNKQSK